MAVNPDPKPGRWILPLVILGMIAFTYFFVRALPEASPDTTLASGPTTTTVPDGSPTTTTGSNEGTVDDAAQAYLDEVEAISGELQLLDTEMVAVNAGFDAEPREIEFGDAEGRMETVTNDAQALAERLAGLTPPEALAANQEALDAQISLAARAAEEALAGLRSADTGELRRAAVSAFTSAVEDFAVEVENTRTAAGASSDA